jgi:hypothetical protein
MGGRQFSGNEALSREFVGLLFLRIGAEALMECAFACRPKK